MSSCETTLTCAGTSMLLTGRRVAVALPTAAVTVTDDDTRPTASEKSTDGMSARRATLRTAVSNPGMAAATS